MNRWQVPTPGAGNQSPLPTVTQAEELGGEARDSCGGPYDAPAHWPQVLRQAFARGWGARGA